MGDIRHKFITDAELHDPKGFGTASNKTVLTKDENGVSRYVATTVLEKALNFVDGNAAPPTEVLGAIYVLIDEGNGAVDSGWDGASYDDWVRFNGTTWVSYTPTDGVICFDDTLDKYKVYDGGWDLLVSGIPGYTTAQIAALTPSDGDFVYDTTLKSLQRYNGSSWVVVANGYGVVSVKDSSGIPLFYSDFATAHTAASSGDTIEIHADLALAAQLSITKLLTIKMNGHNISFDSAGTDDTIYITYTPTGKDVFKFIGGGRIERTGGSSSLTTSLALHFNANDFLDLGTTQLYNDFGTALYLQSTKPTLGGIVWSEDTAIRTANGTPTKMYIYSNNGDGVSSNNPNDYPLNCTINAPNGNGCSGDAGAQMCYINAGLKGIAAAKNDVIGNTIISGTVGVDNSGAVSINVLGNTVKAGTYGMLLSSVLDVKGNNIISVNAGVYCVNAGEIEGNNINVSGGVGIELSTGGNIRRNIVRTAWNNSGGHAIKLGNPGTHDIIDNYLEVVNASAYGIYSANASTFVYHFGNSYKGCTTKTSIAAGNSQTNTEDTIGEILRG